MALTGQIVSNTTKIPNRSISTGSPLKLPDASQFEAPGAAAAGAAATQQIQQRLIDGPQAYQTNSQFQTAAPKAESSVENFVTRSLDNPLVGSAEESQRYFDAQKARQATTFEDQRQKAEARMNRLGLSTSSPGLAAQREIDTNQGLAEEQLAATIAREDYDRNMQAQALANQIANTGLSLGGQQTNRDQFAINATEQDMLRQLQEQQSAASQGLQAQQIGTLGPDANSMLELLRQNPDLVNQLLATNQTQQPLRTLS